MTTDNATTAAGAVGGLGMVAAVNWNAILHFPHDYSTLGFLIAGIGAIVGGWYANKIGHVGGPGNVPSGTPISPQAPNVAGTPEGPIIPKV